jgi:hypothetical protein
MATATGHLRRLVDFTEPRRDDVCLDVGADGLAPALRPRVRQVVRAGAGALPHGTFSLVTAYLALAHAADQVGLIRELLRVCAGRLILADLVRTRTGDGERVERLRDPAYVGSRSLPQLMHLVGRAGGYTRRLDLFTIERPLEPWLVGAHEPDRIRHELMTELEGGPLTGARPRMIGEELWFAQSWAFLAVEPVTQRRPAAAPPRR